MGCFWDKLKDTCFNKYTTVIDYHANQSQNQIWTNYNVKFWVPQKYTFASKWLLLIIAEFKI